MKRLFKILLALVLIFFVLLALIKIRYGGGEDFPLHSYPMTEPMTGMEVVADLPMPPGNLAVSKQGRIFFTFHPEARPDTKVAELVDGKPVAWPNEAFQSGDGEPRHFQNVLSLRIDRQGRLWTLDNANHGLGQVRLLAFDISSGQVIHHYDFGREVAPRLSHFNDFQVSPDGRYIYIADASIMGLTPAIVVYDIETQQARRLLESHVSVVAENYVPTVQGRRMEIFGIFSIRPGVDSIALSRDGRWLYYAAVTATKMYRIATNALLDQSLSPEALAGQVEVYAEKSESDGITTDIVGNIYLSDPGSDAIHLLKPDRSIETLLKSERIRWPDGFSFGPEGWLYFSCSSLQEVIGKSPGAIQAAAPFQIFRFQPGYLAQPGH